MATIPENIKEVFDSTFVKIDTVEELRTLLSEPNPVVFHDNRQISITKDSHTDVKKGFLSLGKGVEVSKDIYRIDTIAGRTFSITSLLNYGIYRKPMLNELTAPEKYPLASGSLHMGSSEEDAIKEQGRIFSSNSELFQTLAEMRNAKEIYLYAKDVKTQIYHKVSVSKGGDLTIYLNPMTPTTRSEEEAKLKAKINGEILSLTAEIDSIQKETEESLKTCAKLSSEGTITGVSTSTLMKNKGKVLEKLTKEKTKLESNLANPAYITSAVKYGEPITLEKLQKKYILIISTKPWVTSTEQDSVAPVAPVAEERDTRSEQIVSKEGVPEQGVSDDKSSEEAAKEPPKEVPKEAPKEPPTSGFFGLFGATGGRRKTKKTNKKSRKGKSKKQNKSRKLFRTFYN